MNISKETKEKIERIQILEQNMQQLHAQKQAHQSQLFESENAAKELEKTQKAYKIVGNIMIAIDKAELTKELDEKKQMSELRLQSIEKQEEQLKEKAKKIQEEILKEMK